MIVIRRVDRVERYKRGSMGGISFIFGFLVCGVGGNL